MTLTGTRYRPAPSRAELAEHLVQARIAGAVATTRENNLGNYRRCSAREPLYTFGLDYGPEWTPERILELMADRVGVSPDPTYTVGVDTIDPELTIDALDRMAARVRRAAERRERVLLGTGHPSGVYAIHLETARALAAAGCPVLTPAAGHGFRDDNGRPRHLRFLGGVGMVSNGGELNHTHSPYPMQAMLAGLAQAGDPPPELVIGDHGYAGAAAEAGIDAVGYADCNDPALFVGEALGKVLVSVPLDDNVLPQLYAPLTAYLLADVARPA